MDIKKGPQRAFCNKRANYIAAFFLCFAALCFLALTAWAFFLPCFLIVVSALGVLSTAGAGATGAGVIGAAAGAVCAVAKEAVKVTAKAAIRELNFIFGKLVSRLTKEANEIVARRRWGPAYGSRSKA